MDLADLPNALPPMSPRASPRDKDETLNAQQLRSRFFLHRSYDCSRIWTMWFYLFCCMLLDQNEVSRSVEIVIIALEVQQSEAKTVMLHFAECNEQPLRKRTLYRF